MNNITYCVVCLKGKERSCFSNKSVRTCNICMLSMIKGKAESEANDYPRRGRVKFSDTLFVIVRDVQNKYPCTGAKFMANIVANEFKSLNLEL